MKKLLTLSAVFAGLALSSAMTLPASAAAGAFDFLDPCIHAREQLSDAQKHMIGAVATSKQEIATMSAPQAFRDWWLDAKKAEERPVYDKQVAPTLAKMGVPDTAKAYDQWFSDLIASVDPQQLTMLIDMNYRQLQLEMLVEDAADGQASIDKARAECKSDVGSQVLRVATAPIGWVAGNFESAKGEKNIFTQVYHAVTGISPDAIAHNGPLGGPNAEARKIVNAIAGGPNGEVRKTLRALDPGNIGGGHNSVFHKPFG
jgi:hypothetical protein